eukprot:Em0054g14a
MAGSKEATDRPSYHAVGNKDIVAVDRKTFRSDVKQHNAAPPPVPALLPLALVQAQSAEIKGCSSTGLSAGKGILERYITQMQPNVLKGEKLTRVNELLVKAFTANLLPPKLMDSPEFREFLDYISNGSYEIPHRTKTTLLIDMQYENVLKKIKAMIADAVSVSIKTDTASMHTGDSYIAITAHWLDSQWNLMSCVLGVSISNAEEISSIVKGSVNTEFMLENRLDAIASDQGANFVAAIRKLIEEGISEEQNDFMQHQQQPDAAGCAENESQEDDGVKSEDESHEDDGVQPEDESDAIVDVPMLPHRRSLKLIKDICTRQTIFSQLRTEMMNVVQKDEADEDGRDDKDYHEPPAKKAAVTSAEEDFDLLFGQKDQSPREEIAVGDEDHIEDEYQSPSQKGFLPFEGCLEHGFVLKFIFQDARKRKKPANIVWFDLKDAFGGPAEGDRGNSKALDKGSHNRVAEHQGGHDEQPNTRPFSDSRGPTRVPVTNARVSSAWKHSTITLLHKGGEPAELKNWRTVSVQLTVYKLYAAIIAKRIASWATAMSSFSPAQKGFLAYDGCGGVHIFLLRSILGNSRREKNLLLAWLDIKDAFPSVSHHLMLSFMERVGLSGSVLRVVQDIYSHATVAIRTGRESRTPPIPQRRGVKQGCLLSPILFNVVIGLLRHLSASQGGYSIARYNINTLAYADDVCVIASSKTKMQSLLDRCAEFGIALTWAERYRYLGCPTGAFRTRDQDLDSVKEDLLRDTSAIFKSLLAEWQKLDVFCRFLFPRLTFIFQVIFPGPIWCRRLDTKLRGIIKQGLKLPQRTCSQYLYLPQASGGLGVPNAEDEAYVAKAAQAFKFLGDTRDPVIRAVALQQLRATVAMRARSPTNS